MIDIPYPERLDFFPIELLSCCRCWGEEHDINASTTVSEPNLYGERPKQLTVGHRRSRLRCGLRPFDPQEITTRHHYYIVMGRTAG